MDCFNRFDERISVGEKSISFYLAQIAYTIRSSVISIFLRFRRRNLYRGDLRRCGVLDITKGNDDGSDEGNGEGNEECSDEVNDDGNQYLNVIYSMIIS